MLDADARVAIEAEALRREDVTTLSAIRGDGIDPLLDRISAHLQGDSAVHNVSLSLTDGSKLAWLHSRGEVIDSSTLDETIHLSVRLSPENWERFQAL